MRYQLVLWTLLVSLLLPIACVDRADENIPIPEITGHTPKNKNARYLASTQNSTASYGVINEYDSSKTMLNETRWSNSFKAIQHFNAKGDLIQLESLHDGKPSINQVNQYNPDGTLRQEFRIEYTEEGTDTILYEYHYLYGPDSLDYLAYRTNNGDTVTRFTMEKKENHTYKTEEAYPYRGFIVLNKQDITKNENGKIISIRSERISSSYKNDPPDTTISTSTYAYNDQGKLIGEGNENDILKANLTRFEYKNGLISKIISDGKTIMYEQFRIAN